MEPYELPDDDSDLLGEVFVTPSSVEETPSSYVVGPGGESIGLPQELHDALTQQNQPSNTMPPQFAAVSGMFDYYSAFTNYHIESPLTLAVAELMNEMSDGRLELLYRFHEAERELFTKSALVAYQAVVYKVLDNLQQFFGDYHTEVKTYMDYFMEVVAFLRERSVENYIKYAEQLGKEVDKELVDKGLFSRSDWMRRAAMGRPRSLTEDER